MNERQINLVNVLSINPKPVKYYAELLGVSVRTLHNDLKVVEKVLNNNGILLIKVPGQGIHVDKEPQFIDVDSVETELTPIIRQFDIFRKLLIDGDTLTYEKLSEEFFVSQSSIRNDLELIENSFLNSNTMKLIRDKKGTYLVGDYSQELETHLLFCQYIYINTDKITLSKTFYEVYSDVYGKEIVETCLSVIDRVEKKNIVFIGDHYRTNLLIILITMVHLKKKSPTHEAITIDEEVKVSYDSHIFFTQTILANISKLTKVSFNKSDILYLVKFLRGIRISGELEKTVFDTKNSLGAKIVNTISEKLKIDLSVSDSIKNQMIIHVNSMLYRVENDIVLKNELTSKIQEEYKVLFNSLWLILNEEIKERFEDKNISSHEVAFIVIYLQTLLSKQRSNKRILVVCPNGISTSQFIVNRLREILPPFDAIEVSSLDKLGNINSEDFNLIVSTTKQVPESDNLVIVSPIFNNNDIIRVSEVYNSKLTRKKEISKHDFNSILSLMDVNQIHIVDDKKFNKEELIECVVNKNIKEGYVDSKYLQAIYDREAMGSTLISEDSAFPHGSPSYVKNSILNLVVVKNGIKWDGSNIKLVFFPCISEADIAIVRELFSELYTLISDKKIVEQIVNSTSAEQVLKILKEN